MVQDEILYHARVHPEERCNVLTNDQLEALHTQTSQVCQTAVSVNADDSKFPEDWLFKHRWGKGKDKRNECTLKLADGKPATIKWITVGGRTSAFVVELQKLKRGVAGLSHGTDEEADDSDLTSLSTSDEEIKVEVEEVTQKSKRKRKLKSPESPPTRITRRKTSGKKTKTA